MLLRMVCYAFFCFQEHDKVIVCVHIKHFGCPTVAEIAEIVNFCFYYI